jgi:hypothetical protein
MSRPSLARRLVPDQLGASPTSSLLDEPPPSSLRLARQVSASHDKPLVRTSSSQLRVRRGPRHAARPRDEMSSPLRVGDRFPAPCKHSSWWRCEQLALTEALMSAQLHSHPIAIISNSAARKLR